MEAQASYWARKAEELRRDTNDIRQCPICGGGEWKEAIRVHGFPWRQCGTCSHVFNGLRPSEAALTRFYEAADETVNHADDYTDPQVREYRKEHVARPKVEFVTKYLPTPARWLDVGCGNGDLLAVAKELGYAAVGLEPNTTSAQIARKEFGLEIHEEPLSRFAATGKQSFNIVSFIGLLDLVPDPMSYLRDAARVLSPGGVVFASFPNYHSLSTSVQSTYTDHVICRHMYPATLNSYTTASVERALKDNGLTVEAYWFFGMDIYETINDLQLGVPGFENSAFHRFLFQNMNTLQAALDKSEQCDKFHLIARKSR
jgi:2-polyprenyl-3-methyl-5-hydroxy-6-metoxy-1,4-benzoquinol methylase